MSLPVLDQRRAEKQFRQTMQARFPAPKATPEAMIAALKAIEASLARLGDQSKGAGPG